MKYDFASIEKKWQQKWLEEKPFTAVTGDKTREKFFGLIEFPYPSGQGLHVGHARPFTAMDIICRKKRMQGYNVLFPIGYDAFGLPTENYAVQHHIHPAKVTHDNIENFRKQLHMLGYSFDWDREVNTTDPSYYKWTQWIFLQMFKKGLAYKASMPVNWCTSCKIVLANEEVVDGVCERCGGQVIRKEKSQWMLAITKYADRLIDDLDDLDFIERVKIQQKNWIGRSEGTEVDFTATNGDKLTVYTTRCDTLFGVTYMVISPEHPYLQQWKDQIQNWDAVAAYIEEAARKSDFERGELNKEKTGVRLEGIEAVNPASGKHVPLFVSDYVLMGYGTGIVMGVPGHDQRDWEFATKFGLPIVEVVQGGDITKEAFTLKDDTGIMVNSGFLDGLTVKEAIPTMKKWVTEQGIGRPKTNFKLRDWVFSRQRYWGEPIPLVNCPKCGWVPLPEEQLPLLLPDVESYELTDDGESPLSKMTDWVNTTCPKCGGPAQRETDTMPQWAGSCWYYLRYLDPENTERFVSREAEQYWMGSTGNPGGVDLYVGGTEHAVLHLLYARFWHKVLFDLGYLTTSEPFQKLVNQGLILGEDGQKMSKSRGNVVNPDDIVREYGADSLRLYEMFMGPLKDVKPWATKGVEGISRFLARVWRVAFRENQEGEWEINPKLAADAPEAAVLPVRKELHKTIRKVTEDINDMSFNTAIAKMMECTNAMTSADVVDVQDYDAFLTLLNPFAPHLTEEIHSRLQAKFPALAETQLCQKNWPVWEETLLVENTVPMVIQVNGRLRDKLEVPRDISREELEKLALASAKVKIFLDGVTVRKVIVVPGRLVNIVAN